VDQGTIIPFLVVKPTPVNSYGQTFFIINQAKQFFCNIHKNTLYPCLYFQFRYGKPLKVLPGTRGACCAYSRAASFPLDYMFRRVPGLKLNRL
jgi:hypothetical protein